MRGHKQLAVFAATTLAMSMTACSSKPTEQRELAPIEITTTRPDAAMPYGAGFEHLANEGPETVAAAALERLCTFTSDEYDAGTVYERVQGITTPEAWRAMTADPKSVTPQLILRTWDTWDQAGGNQTAEVAISNEVHPEDSETSWQRKMTCRRVMDGLDGAFLDSYVLGLEKREGQWRVSQLALMNSTYTPPETSQ